MEKLLIKVKFNESENIYCYTSYDETIKVGDYVLVDSRGYLATPKVVDIKSVNKMTADEKEISRNGNVKNVLSKLDFTIFERGKEYEKKKSDLRARIEARYNEMSEIAKYKVIAQSDETLAKMLEEYESL